MDFLTIEWFRKVFFLHSIRSIPLWLINQVSSFISVLFNFIPSPSRSFVTKLKVSSRCWMLRCCGQKRKISQVNFEVWGERQIKFFGGQSEEWSFFMLLFLLFVMNYLKVSLEMLMLRRGLIISSSEFQALSIRLRHLVCFHRNSK